MRKKRGPNRRLSVTVGDDFETFQHGDDDLAWHTLEMARFLTLSLADSVFFCCAFSASPCWHGFFANLDSRCRQRLLSSDLASASMS
jgi:hypothetical protein